LILDIDARLYTVKPLIEAPGRLFFEALARGGVY
jgi:hypothetical protein